MQWFFLRRDIPQRESGLSFDLPAGTRLGGHRDTEDAVIKNAKIKVQLSIGAGSVFFYIAEDALREAVEQAPRHDPFAGDLIMDIFG